MAAFDEAAPGLRTRTANVSARIALAAGDLAAAAAAAHAALRTAIDARLVLLQVDTVETIAVIAVAAGEPAAASRLLAATNAERDRRGYLGRTLSAASMSNIAELQADQESAWTEGSALTLSEAIDLAERSAFGVGAGG